MMYVPQDKKHEFKKLFKKVENADGDQERIKLALEDILNLSKSYVDQGRINEMDLVSIENNVCKILDYYSIQSKFCQAGDEKQAENVQNIEGEKKEGGMFGTILRIIMWVLGILLFAFVVLVIVFAVKAKKQQKQEKSNNGQTDTVK